jgi:UrcA family protein
MTTATKLKTYLGGAALVAAASLAICATPVISHAQGDYDQYANSSLDETAGVTVYAPRYMDRDAASGAPIERVSTSRVVEYGDLDINTDWGSRILHRRIVRAAREACDQLDTQYPLTSQDSPPCVQTAVRNAMYDVRYGGDE